VVLHPYPPGETAFTVIPSLDAAGKPSKESLLRYFAQEKGFLPALPSIRNDKQTFHGNLFVLDPTFPGIRPIKIALKAIENQELQQRKSAAARNKPLMMMEPPSICKSPTTTGAELFEQSCG